VFQCISLDAGEGFLPTVHLGNRHKLRMSQTNPELEKRRGHFSALGGLLTDIGLKDSETELGQVGLVSGPAQRHLSFSSN